MKKRFRSRANGTIALVGTQRAASVVSVFEYSIAKTSNGRRNLRPYKIASNGLLFAFLVLFCNIAHAQMPTTKTAKAKTGYNISAEKYATELRRALRTLDGWESKSPTIAAARAALPTVDERRIKRADGATMTVSGAQWDRVFDQFQYSNATKTKLNRREVRSLREIFAQRATALQNWMSGNYQPAAAQSIVSTLEDSGEIRTGPTATQVWWQNLKDSIANFWSSLFKNSMKKTAPTKMPNVNTKWIEWLFISCVLCLLGAIAWYVWKSFGGRFSRGARREVRFVGEDAELLQLPPDELLSRAANLARKGDFAGALRHRYIGVLVTLDERAVWRYDTRRTNWEHIAALRKTPRWQNLTSPLSELTRVFDRVRYGNASVAETDWTRFDRDAASLEELSQSSTRSDSATLDNAQMGARA